MTNKMRKIFLLYGIIFIISLYRAPEIFSATSDAPAPEVILAKNDKSEILLGIINNSLEIVYNKKRLLLYSFNTNQFKPYVKELYTVDGKNVLRDAPPDHLHHHGLMYAITVNGINFWEESKNAGIQVPISVIRKNVSANSKEKPTAEFTQLIHWVAQTNRAAASNESVALLIEKRSLKLIVDETENSVLLYWSGSFKVGSSVSNVVLSGTDYHGLGLRFPIEFDKTARHINSSDAPYPTGGKHDLVEAQWGAVSGLIDNQMVTVAVVSSPTNKGRSVFFSMTQPFAYLSATQALSKQPITYKSGDSFDLNYAIMIFSGLPDRKVMNQKLNELFN